MNTMTRRRGFTVVELLVVISIIALLISLLIPTLGRAREAGRTSVCLSGMRQLAMSSFAYAGDYSGYLPIGSMYDGNIGLSRAHRWYIAIGPYVSGEQLPDSTPSSMTTPSLTGKAYRWDYNTRGRTLTSATHTGYSTYKVVNSGRANQYTCPSTRDYVLWTQAQLGPTNGAWDVDYMINGSITGWPNYYNVTSNGVVVVPAGTWFQAPRRAGVSSRGWLLMDGDSFYATGGYLSYGHYALGVGCEISGGVYLVGTELYDNMHATRHAGGLDGDGTANLAFADGHAESNWSHPRIADAAYGPDFPRRNGWWRGDQRVNLVNALTPF